MKFQPYDILSTILPGYIFYAFLIKLFPQSQFEFDVLPSIAIAYLIGYILNTISSLIEPLYFLLWGGKPSSNLLLGKGINKVKFTEWMQTKHLLLEDYQGVINSEKKESLDALFNVASRKANTAKNPRIADFNATYALARAILTCVIAISPFIIFVFWKNHKLWLIVIALLSIIFLVGLRARQRGYYFSREVLNTYLVESTKQQ